MKYLISGWYFMVFERKAWITVAFSLAMTQKKRPDVAPAFSLAMTKQLLELK